MSPQGWRNTTCDIFWTSWRQEQCSVVPAADGHRPLDCLCQLGTTNTTSNKCSNDTATILNNNSNAFTETRLTAGSADKCQMTMGLVSQLRLKCLLDTPKLGRAHEGGCMLPIFFSFGDDCLHHQAPATLKTRWGLTAQDWPIILPSYALPLNVPTVMTVKGWCLSTPHKIHSRTLRASVHTC